VSVNGAAGIGDCPLRSASRRVIFSMKKSALIVSSPGVLNGTPVFAGTRVPVKNLTDYLEAGESLDAFLEDFPTVTRA